MSNVDTLAPCEDDCSGDGSPPVVLLTGVSAGNAGDASVRRHRAAGPGGGGEAEPSTQGSSSPPAAACAVEPVRGGGVVCLVAGPGYGKTAFIVDLLSSAGGRTVYFSVDEGDRDPVRFLSYLMAGPGHGAVRSAGRSVSGLVGLRGNRWASWSSRPRLVDFISARPGRRRSSPSMTFTWSTRLPGGEHAGAARAGLAPRLDRALVVAASRAARSRRSEPGRQTRANLQGRELRLTPQRGGRVGLTELGRTAAAVGSAGPVAPHPGLAGGAGAAGPAPAVRRRRCDPQGHRRGHQLGVAICARTWSGTSSPGSTPFAARTMLTAGLLPRVMFPRDEAFLPGLPGQAEAVLEEFVSRGFLVTRAGRRSYTVHPLVRGFAERQASLTDEETGLISRAAAHLRDAPASTTTLPPFTCGPVASTEPQALCARWPCRR